jgi:putative ribosome biogenesis GTPase RsgA
MLLGCYWDAKRPMSKSNKRGHAVVDTPGMQVVAALRCSCNKKEHTVVDTPGMQVVAALRCSCNKKEHAVVDTPGISTGCSSPTEQLQ